MVFGGVDRKFQFPGAFEQGFLELSEAERYATLKRLAFTAFVFQMQANRFGRCYLRQNKNSKARPLAMPKAVLFVCCPHPNGKRLVCCLAAVSSASAPDSDFPIFTLAERDHSAC